VHLLQLGRDGLVAADLHADRHHEHILEPVLQELDAGGQPDHLHHRLLDVTPREAGLEQARGGEVERLADAQLVDLGAARSGEAVWPRNSRGAEAKGDHLDPVAMLQVRALARNAVEPHQHLRRHALSRWS
jgi:hypothetical protein